MRRTLLILICLLLPVFLPAGSAAQQPRKIPKIGWLGERGSGSGRELFGRQLRELGYIEGKNIIFEYRYAEGKAERLPVTSEELVRLKVDVLVTLSTAGAVAAKNATSTVPIIFSMGGDPVAGGLVDSLARPGGNITGFTNFGAVLAGKRLELLKETLPKLTSVAVVWDPQDPSSVQQWKESQLPARELGLQLHSIEASSADKFESAFEETSKLGGAALAVPTSPFTTRNAKRITALAGKYRLPAIFSREDFVEVGGLMSYGADRVEPFRRVALMVDKILKGTKPADIPVEQPTKFLAIPPVVLMRAERVIR